MQNQGGPVPNFPLAERARTLALEQRAATRPNFQDYERTFHHLSDGELTRKYWLFRIIGKPALTNFLNAAGSLAVRLRVPGADWMVRQTIYDQFVGGRSLASAQPTIEKLARLGVTSILDYGAEAKQDKEDMDGAMKEIIRSIDFAADTPAAQHSVVKLSSIIPFAVLEGWNPVAERLLNPETAELAEPNDLLVTGLKRFDAICGRAAAAGVGLFIDAEESWIQASIDALAERMMRRYNTEQPIVCTTIQLYRHDKLAYLKRLYAGSQEEGWKLGVKLVRGAYMNKENARAAERGYPTPIQPNIESTHRDYDAGVRFLFEHRESMYGILGTHNVASTRLLTDLIDEHLVDRSHPNLAFAQLLGMSDNLTFNLAYAGFNVSKYMVYGPVREVLPYLVRRAQENTSVTGETGRELQLIQQELERRG